MAVLTVDVGGSPLSLNCTRGGHAAPRRVGNTHIGNSGTEESSVRAELMVIPVVTDPIPLATAATVRTKFAIGNQVPCAGDIINKPGTITFSGTITDELRETADSVILNLTLFEVGTDLTVESATGSTTTPIYLTSDPSPEDPGDGSVNQGDVGAMSFGGLESVRILDAYTLTTCGTFPDPSVTCPTVFSTIPEKSWLTPELAAGTIVGLPRVTILSNGGPGDQFATQVSKMKLFLVRSGVDVATTQTGYSDSNGGFSGGLITMTGLGAVAWTVEDGDQLRIEAWGRAALHGGYSDTNDGVNLARQTITFGYLGAGLFYGQVSIGGSLVLL